MIITCPSCHTKFQIPPTSLGEHGRNVRCSSCGERWFVEAFTQAAEPPPLPEPAVSAAAVAATGRQTLLSLRPTRLVPWLAAAVILLLMAAAVAGRDEIAARLPATAPAFQRLGLSLELPLGIEFRDLDSQRQTAQGREVLVVTGEIANISGERREVPSIRVALLDGGRREVDHGLFDPPKPTLAAGAAARFEVKLDAPPPEASDFAVSFADEP